MSVGKKSNKYLGGLAAIVMALATSPCAPAQKNQKAVVVPFEATTSPLILVPVRINHSAPLWFIIDTGADTSLIDSGTAEKLGLKIENPHQNPEPGGAITEGTIASATVQIGDASPEPMPIEAAPISALGQKIGHAFDGLIGHDLLQRYTVKIDYQARQISLFRPDDFKDSGHATEIPITIDDSQVFIPIEIKGAGRSAITGKFKVDTGSVDFLDMNNNFVVDNHLIGEKQRKLPSPGVAIGGETNGFIFVLDSAKVGPITFERSIVGYTTDSKGFENRPNAGGIGGTLLSRFVVVFDYSRKRILLTPVGPARQEVPYDMSGVLLNADGPDWKRITIASIIPGSPAAEAGLQVGDQIVTINGVTPHSLMETLIKFRRPGAWHLKIQNTTGTRDLVLRTRPLLSK